MSSAKDDDDLQRSSDEISSEVSRPDKPPLLDYPTPVREPLEPDTESWSEVGRAMLVVLSVLAFLFFIGFGLCGVLVHGCE